MKIKAPIPKGSVINQEAAEIKKSSTILMIGPQKNIVTKNVALTEISGVNILSTMPGTIFSLHSFSIEASIHPAKIATNTEHWKAAILKFLFQIN